MAIERFYILKDGARDGPYDESYVRFLLENDEIGFDDFCETEGGERLRLGALYESVDEDSPVDQDDLGGEQGESLRETREPARRIRPDRVLYLGHPSFFRFTLSWLLTLVGLVGGYLIGP
ncbi:MAG: hypothetical protein ACI9MB_002154, partial [Verrucomicrobiales bacterium]